MGEAVLNEDQMDEEEERFGPLRLGGLAATSDERRVELRPNRRSSA